MPKAEKRRPGPLVYLELMVAVVLLAGVNYIFTKLIDALFGNSNAASNAGIIIVLFVFLFAFTIYIWAVDRHGVFARMLGQGGDTGTIRVTEREGQETATNKREINESVPVPSNSRPAGGEPLLKLIQNVDDTFEQKWFIAGLRVFVALPRIAFFGAALFGVYVGWHYAQLAAAAAQANLLELSIGVQSLSVAILALVFAILAIVGSEEREHAEQRRFALRIFKHLKNNREEVVLWALIKIRMALPASITLEEAYGTNPGLFNENDLLRAVLGP